MDRKNVFRIIFSMGMMLFGISSAAFPQLASADENLVLNPSFETAGTGGATDAANWTEGTNHQRASDKAHSGSWSLKSTFVGTGTATYSTLAVPVNANTIYTYSGFIWKAASTGSACLDMNDIAGEVQLCVHSVTGSWEFVSGTWNSGTRTSVTLRLVTDGTPNGIIWFDDISLVPSSAPTSTDSGATSTAGPTNTRTPSPTNTASGATSTAGPTNTNTSTRTPGPTNTASGATSTAGPTRTKTPGPTPTKTPALIVAAAGDIACGAGSSGGMCKQMETSNLLISINPDRILPLGDNQYEQGALSDFQSFYDPSWGRLKSKTSPVVGNHEYLTTGATGYYNYFGAAAGDPSKGYYSYNIRGWHFIALNSNCTPAGGCSAGKPQYVWLQNDLNASSALCTIAYMHHPLWSSSTFATASEQPLVQLLYDKGVELLLVGHAHNYERFARQNASGGADSSYGIREIVVGTGGRNFTTFGTIAANSQVRNDTTFGVLKLTLRTSNYTWQFMPIAGSTFTDGPTTDACHGPHP